uniref:Sphingosine kinase 1 n=1 Tax=Stegastes partitus TaxID=144197 RepID=A0A3B4Z6Z9_9TELE
MLWLIVLLENKSSSKLRFSCRLHQVVLQDLLTFCFIHFIHKPPRTCCYEASPHYDAATSVLYDGDGVFVMKCRVWCSPIIVSSPGVSNPGPREPLSSVASPVSSEELLVSCGFLLCKGLVSRMDLVSIHLSSSPRLFSFLSLAWGFVADVDIESEKYRHVGAARFTVGTLVRLASLRVYKGKLAYLPASSLTPAPVLATKAPAGPPDSLLVPLDQPLPANWVVVPEEDFVLMLAMYQSHLAEDLLAAPDAALDDGVIHLFYVRAGISRTALLRLFLAMEKGAHLATNCQHLVHTKVRALRLEPYSPKGIITVDGEVVEYGPLQAEVHGGLSRLITG